MDLDIKEELEVLGYSNLSQKHIEEIQQQVEQLLAGERDKFTQKQTSVVEKLRNELHDLGFTHLTDEMVMSIHNELEILLDSSGLALSDLISSDSNVDDNYSNGGSSTDQANRVDEEPPSKEEEMMPEEMSEILRNKNITRKVARKGESGARWVENVKLPLSADDVDTYMSVSLSTTPSSELGRDRNRLIRDMISCSDKSSVRQTSKIPKPKSFILPLDKVPYQYKRWDPVSRYHFYRKIWEKQATPEEKKRSSLRWKTRHMLTDKNAVLSRKKTVEDRKKRMLEIVKSATSSKSEDNQGEFGTSPKSISQATLQWLHSHFNPSTHKDEEVEKAHHSDAINNHPPPQPDVVKDLIEYRLQESEEEYIQELIRLGVL